MHGVIVVDKPSGPSSAEVIRQVKKRLSRDHKVGHLGTLDPFATGVLPVLVGEGTKLAPFLHEGEKTYSGLIALGAETDTLDRTGAVVREAPIPALDQERLAALVTRFSGAIDQTPPIFSAIKRAGVPSYKLARRGVEVAPHAARRVVISFLELDPAGADLIRFRVGCSAGMYVRALARDIGLAIDSAAHLTELRRECNGNFVIAWSIPLEALLDALDRGEPIPLISLREALADMPEVEVEALLEQRLRHGDSSALNGLVPGTGEFFKVIARDQLIAVAKTTSRVTAAIERIFNT